MENIFDKIAPDYDKTVALINSLDDWVFIRNLPKGRERVLDIGCGSGQLLLVLSKYFKECFGIDSSKGMIALAKVRNKKFKVVVGDAHKLPYLDEYFDLVVSHTTFHHLDQTKAINEAKRVLKKGGRLVIVDVVLEKNILRKLFEKFWYRVILSMLRMYIRYGAKETVKAWQYKNGPLWREHVGSEKAKFFNKKQFRDFFSRLLPKARFGTANYAIGYLTWIKK